MEDGVPVAVFEPKPEADCFSLLNKSSASFRDLCLLRSPSSDAFFMAAASTYRDFAVLVLKTASGEPMP